MAPFRNYCVSGSCRLRNRKNFCSLHSGTRWIFGVAWKLEEATDALGGSLNEWDLLDLCVEGSVVEINPGRYYDVEYRGGSVSIRSVTVTLVFPSE